jgi:hypothetical protein
MIAYLKTLTDISMVDDDGSSEELLYPLCVQKKQELDSPRLKVGAVCCCSIFQQNHLRLG